MAALQLEGTSASSGRLLLQMDLTDTLAANKTAITGSIAAQSVEVGTLILVAGSDGASMVRVTAFDVDAGTVTLTVADFTFV